MPTSTRTRGSSGRGRRTTRFTPIDAPWASATAAVAATQSRRRRLSASAPSAPIASQPPACSPNSDIARATRTTGGRAIAPCTVSRARSSAAVRAPRNGREDRPRSVKPPGRRDRSRPQPIGESSAIDATRVPCRSAATPGLAGERRPRRWHVRSTAGVGWPVGRGSRSPGQQDQRCGTSGSPVHRRYPCGDLGGRGAGGAGQNQRSRTSARPSSAFSRSPRRPPPAAPGARCPWPPRARPSAASPGRWACRRTRRRRPRPPRAGRPPRPARSPWSPRAARSRPARAGARTSGRRASPITGASAAIIASLLSSGQRTSIFTAGRASSSGRGRGGVVGPGPGVHGSPVRRRTGWPRRRRRRPRPPPARPPARSRAASR